MSTRCDARGASFTFTTPDGAPVLSNNLWLSNFSLNLGIGTSSSTLDMELVVDPCQNQGAGTIAEVGTPVLFAVYANAGSNVPGLTFGGILTNATETLSSNGLRYRVQVIDPRKMLEYVSVLLKGYHCPLPDLEINNFMNAAAWMTDGVAVCTSQPNPTGGRPFLGPGSDTHNWPRVGNCNNWGRSAGENNVYLVDALKAIQVRNSGILTTNGQYRLSLDMQLLLGTLIARAPYARTSSSDISLLNLISEACDACGCDFYVTLQGYTIVINLIDRTIIPSDDNPIQQIISAGFNSGICTKGERGFEEIYTNSHKLVLGEQVHYLANVITEEKARMMLGYDLAGFPIQVDRVDFTVPINISPLNNIINGIPPMYPVSEEEILCSATSEMWKLYGILKPDSLSGLLLRTLGLFRFADLGKVLRAFEEMKRFAENGNVNDFNLAMSTLCSVSSIVKTAVNTVLYEQAYSWFQQFIKTWYGRYWLVPVNPLCAYAPYGYYNNIASEGGAISLTDVPVDSAYGNPANRMGLIDTSLFITNDNKVTGFGMISATGNRDRTILGKKINFKVSGDFSDNNYIYQPTNNMIYGSLTTTGQVYNNPQTGTNDVIIQTPFLPLRINVNNKIFTQGLRALAALLGPDSEDFIKDHSDGIKGTSSKTSINIFKLNDAAAMYYAVNIPMRSNIYVYGPWLGTQGQVGSTEINKTDLSPWAYGDYAGMNTVGMALATAGLRFTNKTESGSITLAEPPAYSIGVFRNTTSVISNINVNYNDSGVTTDYSFKVYAAKFGQYAKALADEVQKANKERYKILDFFREERKRTLVFTAETRKSIAQRLKDAGINDIISRVASPNLTASPSCLLIGGYFDAVPLDENGEELGQETETFTECVNPTIGIMNINTACEFECEDSDQEDSSEEDPSSSTTRKNYGMGLNTLKEVESAVDSPEAIFNIALMSLDGLIAPVSIKGRNNRLSQYFKSWDKESKDSMATGGLPPINRTNNGIQSLPINQKYLNPILSKTLMNEWDTRGSSDSTNIMMLGFSDNLGDIKSSYDPARYDDYDDFGFCGLRGPLVLQSWGYDTNGKPIPNAADTEQNSQKGIFNNTGVVDKFMDNWLANPKTWPVGPIDLRFDRKRGVWVSAPVSELFIVAQLTENITQSGSGEARVLNPNNFFESCVGDIACATITVNDFLGKDYTRGTTVYAKYNDGKYIIVEHKSSSPLILTGTAVAKFEPKDLDNIRVKGAGYDSECLEGGNDIEWTDIQNPLGYGAEAGDMVTIQRICGVTEAYCPGGKYIVIGTGAPPIEC